MNQVVCVRCGQRFVRGPHGSGRTACPRCHLLVDDQSSALTLQPTFGNAPPQTPGYDRPHQTIVIRPSSPQRQMPLQGRSWFKIFFGSTAGCLSALILVPALFALAFGVLNRLSERVVNSKASEAKQKERASREEYAKVVIEILRGHGQRNVSQIAKKPILGWAESTRADCDTEIYGRCLTDGGTEDFRIGIKETAYMKDGVERLKVEPIFIVFGEHVIWESSESSVH